MIIGPLDLASLLAALGHAGAELAPHPGAHDRLRHRPPTLPPEWADALRTHRAAILGLLTGGYNPHDDAEYAYVERLGVADGLGLATHPGAPAWLVAVGESMGINR